MTRPRLLTGDVREVLKGLDPESVQCVVTSPPYWGLRDYGTATWEGGDVDCDHTISMPTKWNDPKRGTKYTRPEVAGRGGDASACHLCGAKRVDSQLGLEETPEEYVENMVSVFREVKRVLRKDGTVWLNLGDSYAGGGRAGKNPEYKAKHTNFGKVQDMSTYTEPSAIPIGLKPKDLVGIPWRVAFALQADGWWLRNDIIWNKPNPMPEPVKDRLTKSHEYIFLLTKSKKYYYDNEAIKEPYTESSIQRINQASFDQQTGGDKDYGKISVHSNNTNSMRGTLEKFKENLGSGRNRRSVWEVVTKPYPGAHFATFPEEIPEICIKAGTSKAGCCADCGSPYERIVEKTYLPTNRKSPPNKGVVVERKDSLAGRAAHMTNDGFIPNRSPIITEKGWESTCDCNGEKVPCVVLDPFVGSGTTCAVASRLGRESIGIDLNEEYLKLARKRCKVDSESLFNYV